MLKIKVVGGPTYGQFFVRNPMDGSRQHVLGRVDDCDIHINDGVMSKHHCMFQFMPGPPTATEEDPKLNNLAGHWILKDGYSGPSLNGTWVYLSNQTPIESGMVFKASEILFETKLY